VAGDALAAVPDAHRAAIYATHGRRVLDSLEPSRLTAPAAAYYTELLNALSSKSA
jgi:hypothetical protein